MIEAVTFDFWETLAQDSLENFRRTGDLRAEGLAKVLAQAGPEYERSLEALAAAHEASMSRIAEIWYTGRDLGTRGQVEILLACLEPVLPGPVGAGLWPALEDAYATPALQFPPQVREGASRVLWALRGRGIRLGLISNTGRTPGHVLRIILERAGLLEHFEALSFSDEAGIRKPDPRIFRWTLNKLGVRAERAAHVGDALGTDVAGAQAAGLRGIHLADGGLPPARDPRAEDPTVTPDAVIRDFDELLTALELFGLPAAR